MCIIIVGKQSNPPRAMTSEADVQYISSDDSDSDSGVPVKARMPKKKRVRLSVDYLNETFLRLLSSTISCEIV